jgi:hypothetical protein
MIHPYRKGFAGKRISGKLLRRLDTLKTAFRAAAGDIQRFSGKRHFRMDSGVF